MSSSSGAIWFLILLAVLAANLPFFTERLLAVLPLPAALAPKNLAWRLLELALLYCVVGGVGLFLEARAGRVVVQGWEFYAVTAALFLTLAFPGFVWRYLRRQP
ncbi:DUF2818 family protein [Hylemonella sp. W303a]|uniref:DUF2818 family protein n=1 Tax=Hylemonella sp. W303a TaxID=3389873 RepID=UPI00396B2C9D